MLYNCDLLEIYNNNNNNTANDSDESSEFAHAVEPVIYYGDKNVNIGQPFEITCVIPITEKIHWMKNGESIARHNLRHGHDEHSYSLSETAIEGEYIERERGGSTKVKFLRSKNVKLSGKISYSTHGEIMLREI